MVETEVPKEPTSQATEQSPSTTTGSIFPNDTPAQTGTSMGVGRLLEFSIIC
jgi:hypothetical protein